MTSSEDLWQYATGTPAKLFMALIKVYGTLWTREHGENPSAAFSEWAKGLEPGEVVRIVSRARESQAGGNKFPPALGELTLWASQPGDIELYEIRTRVMSGEWSNEIEQWIVQNARFNLQRVAEDKFIKTLRGYYFQASELKRAGKLFTARDAFLALPKVSEVNLNDKVRNSYSPSSTVANRVSSIISRIKRSQKNQPESDSDGCFA